MACPTVCPKFSDLRIPFSFGSSVTTFSLTSTDSFSNAGKSVAEIISLSIASNFCKCFPPRSKPCFNISAKPERSWRRGKVFKKATSMITFSGTEKVPISFFNPLKLIPVFPPTEASTCANKVVGILIHFIPRLKQEAANPPRSVTSPPPRLISSAFLRAPSEESSRQISSTLPRDL